ncbi:argininosuccinate lyase [Fulvivirga sp. RKSG066]|uniref:argininosuccinate lyase n=1 Tax=Fulvivirga aurantia TaxID=2529383 RepID=UPI0012BCD472|nr:argininosuccinate lyase [Fulvivirga aurantia]MTI22510.1 argininosuccinate lyase [Fulvivirga aurantia]
MKLWDKGYKTAHIVESFTVGKDRLLDQKLAKYDVQGNIAHAKMLAQIDILSTQELNQILHALDEIEGDIASGTFQIEEQFEDIHSKIEHELTEKIGEAGKKIHTARSRNDQVLVDLHLYCKDEIDQIKRLINKLFHTLINLSDKYKNVLLPGYTHMQVAMPSSFGLWFSAYAECLVDDITLLNAAYKIADQNPLGSAAGYGTSFPIDRQMTTDLLGFDSLKYNVVAAQMSRGRLETSVAYGLASTSSTLSKLASDVCLYMSQNFNFIAFPKELTTGSSIMPHKQNPDVFELVRAKCNVIQNLPGQLMSITSNLTSGYHRDLQVLKELLINNIDSIKECLEVSTFMLENIIVNQDIINQPIYDHLFTVETVNQYVMDGLTFREAYKKVGKEVLQGEYKPEKKVKHTHEGSIGNLCLTEIKEKFEKAY